MEELITVDAIGCFEGEDDYEEDGNEDEEEDTVTPQVSGISAKHSFYS